MSIRNSWKVVILRPCIRKRWSIIIMEITRKLPIYLMGFGWFSRVHPRLRAWLITGLSVVITRKIMKLRRNCLNNSFLSIRKVPTWKNVYIWSGIVISWLPRRHDWIKRWPRRRWKVFNFIWAVTRTVLVKNKFMTTWMRWGTSCLTKITWAQEITIWEKNINQPWWVLRIV